MECYALLLYFSLVHFSNTGSVIPRLESYNVNKDLVSVSGFSSGAFFAVQFHVAFSKSIMGVGAVAGGPFWCAQNNVLIALSSCMKSPELIVVSQLVTITYTAAVFLTIDSPSNIKNDNVYLYSGTADTVVVPGVVKKLEEYYLHFTSNMKTEFSVPSEHAMVTDEYGHDCGFLGNPFINNCNYSTAYNLLNHIYGDIKMGSSASFKVENLIEFDQTEFWGRVQGSMDTTGYIYVPSNCQDKINQCRLHIAFHGCQQGRVYLSSTYSMHAGYNGLAEENDIIILYPQVAKSDVIPYNPKGCWDWWGYTTPAYASKEGVQMLQVRGMMDRVLFG